MKLDSESGREGNENECALAACTLYASEDIFPVQENTNPFWDGTLEKNNNGNISFLPYIVSCCAAGAPTDICFLLCCCVAQLQQQIASCLLHTHDLCKSQTIQQEHNVHLFNYTYKPRVFLMFCPYYGMIPNLLLNHNLSQIFIPGHNKVSSLKEPTVSRDDSIVVALPSNILPAIKKDEKQG